MPQGTVVKPRSDVISTPAETLTGGPALPNSAMTVLSASFSQGLSWSSCSRERGGREARGQVLGRVNDAGKAGLGGV